MLCGISPSRVNAHMPLFSLHMLLFQDRICSFPIMCWFTSGRKNDIMILNLILTFEPVIFSEYMTRNSKLPRKMDCDICYLRIRDTNAQPVFSHYLVFWWLTKLENIYYEPCQCYIANHVFDFLYCGTLWYMRKWKDFATKHERIAIRKTIATAIVRFTAGTVGSAVVNQEIQQVAIFD